MIRELRFFLSECDIDTPQFRGLMAKTAFSDEFNINIDAIRPCVAVIWSAGIEKGGIIDRTLACSILASEFLKLGYDQSRIEREATRWNKKNHPPLKQSELRATLRTAFAKQYKYSCNHYSLRALCAGRDSCLYVKGLKKGKRYDSRVFIKYGWQKILSHKAKLIYWIGLQEIEKRYGFSPGSRLYVGHREIADISGITPKYVKKGLEELSFYKLITFKPGSPKKWEGKATEVRRTIPIPAPPREAL